MIRIGYDDAIDGLTVLRPEGELDAFTVAGFRQAMAAIRDLDRLILDLSDVAFVDSAGLGALIGAIRQVREAGGQVCLICNRPGLLTVLRSTGFDSTVPVLGSVEEAATIIGASCPARPAEPRQSQGDPGV